MGLVKTRRLAAMHPPSRCALRRTGKQQRAKAGMKPPMKGDSCNDRPRQFCVNNVVK